MNTVMNCQSEYVVSCYGAFFQKPDVFIALEFMDLGTLSNLYTEDTVLEEPVLGHIAYQMLKGLSHLHKKMRVIHRDIKPSNVLINSEG